MRGHRRIFKHFFKNMVLNANYFLVVLNLLIVFYPNVNPPESWVLPKYKVDQSRTEGKQSTRCDYNKISFDRIIWCSQHVLSGISGVDQIVSFSPDHSHSGVICFKWSWSWRNSWPYVQNLTQLCHNNTSISPKPHAIQQMGQIMWVFGNAPEDPKQSCVIKRLADHLQEWETRIEQQI